MSEENKLHIPNNEEIVEDLTKELESQFNVSEETNDIPNNCSDAAESKTNDTEYEKNCEDSDDSGVDAEKPSVPDDFVDETALKDAELELTDEEKEERRKKALEFKNKGNTEFKSENFVESINLYTEGLRTCPSKFESDRAVLYANRAACKVQLGRKESALDDCVKAIELNPNYVRVYIRRAKLYEELGKLDESLADYKKVLEFDAGNKEALMACTRLPPLIEERNEKLKEEMLGKLKDLGNMFLRPFGLSTDNFQLQKDPNSGGYSVNFQQNQRK